MRHVVVLSLLLVLTACAPDDRGAPSIDGGVEPTPAADASGPVFIDAGPPPEAFPAAPIVETGAPADAPTLFGSADGNPSGGPCLIEPEAGTLYPRNWLRPRFTWAAGSDQNLFELRLHAASQHHDLVVYTTRTSWTMPAALWSSMSTLVADEPIGFTVRGARWTGTSLVGVPLIGSFGSFTIAPVAATGSIVYWTNVSGQTSEFKGFQVGEETVHPVLVPSQANVACVGCHSSTPDGKYVAFSANPHPVFGDQSHVQLRSLDGNATTPPFITAAGATLLARAPNQEQPIFTPAHWSDGDHLAVSMFPVDGRPEIVWTDLEATSTDQGVGWGVVTRTGDTGQAGAAAWSHDGTRFVYSSGPLITSGMNLDDAHGDLYMVPFAGGAGGLATPLAGASSPDFTEHYAAFSADDRLVAFVRLGASENPYDNARAEVFVVPAEGGTPVRLAANDPTACLGESSPGIANTWPKWSPRAETSGGRTYYFLTFSSKRAPETVPQLYVTPVVTDEIGTVTTYPAIYLWNQPAAEHNHTPAWDAFDIPVE
jgi:hypothetical protein